MPGRLWRVRIETSIYVVADDEAGAEAVALAAAEEEIRLNGNATVSTVPVRSPGGVAPRWADAIPWGDNEDDLTCRQFLERHGPEGD